MTDQPQSYTERQLKTLDILRRNRMAWIMFFFLLGAFLIVLSALIYSAFWSKGGNFIKAAFFLLDGVLGWSIKQVVAYLFPSILPAGQDREPAAPIE